MTRTKLLGRLPLAVVLAWTFVGTGCATIATGGGGSQKVTVTSNPPGATVLVDGQPQGVTPAKVSLSRKSEHKVELQAPGYETAHLTITKKFNPWLLGNILVGGLIGVVVDVATDATYKLSPDEVTVQMKAATAVPSSPAPVQQTAAVQVPPSSESSAKPPVVQ